MAVARHARPPELVDVPLAEIAERYTRGFRDITPDWAAFEDAKIEGYKRAQHRFIGAGGSGKHGDDEAIPPRGFTNAAFETAQSPVVDYAYADGQYWDATLYLLPNEARRVDVAYYYQVTSKEYIEFLRDENVTNSKGQELYDLWAANGKCPPELMERVVIDFQGLETELLPGSPGPGRGITR